MVVKLKILLLPRWGKCDIFIQKNHVINVIKLYLVSLTGLTAYAAFIQTKVLKTAANLPPEKLTMFSVFGVVFTILIFIFGWSLLSYVSHVLASITKSQKHISQMRFIKSKVFPNDLFEKMSIMPITHEEVPVHYSPHLPIIFSTINFLTLSMSFFFLQISQDKYIAFTLTSSVFAIASMFYPSACTKFKKHLICAERSCPEKSQVIISHAISRKINQLKSTSDYKIKLFILIFFLCIFAMAKIFGLYLYFNESPMLKHVITVDSVALLLIFSFRYLLEKFRIKIQIEQIDKLTKNSFAV